VIIIAGLVILISQRDAARASTRVRWGTARTTAITVPGRGAAAPVPSARRRG
jgi:hypothetical protein